MDGLCKRSGREAVALSAILAITSMVAPVFTTAASAAKGGGAGLALTVVADATQVSPGQPVGFAVTVSDPTSGALTSVSLQEPLPAGSGVNWSLASQSGSACALSGSPPSQTLSCSIASLAAGASYTAHVVSATTSSSSGAYSTTATAAVAKQATVTATASLAVGTGLISLYRGISNPYGITAGPDGAVWFTNYGNNAIGRISTAGKVNIYPDPSISQPYGITAGPDGALWFTNYGNSTIGRITTAGLVSHFTDPSISRPHGITAGPDGALWFTNYAPGGSIGRITTAGKVTNYTDPTIDNPEGITAGPHKSLWFTNSNTGAN
ncbi:MAG: hypothetical protein E6I33_00950, partial [Chloroflexi bacterium]